MMLAKHIANLQMIGIFILICSGVIGVINENNDRPNEPTITAWFNIANKPRKQKRLMVDCKLLLNFSYFSNA